MRKLIISISIFALCVIPISVYAHITGAFGDFLVGIQGKNSDDNLKKEIANTKREIEDLKPVVEKMSKDYHKNEDVATDKLVFYTHESIDTFSQFMLEEKDILSMLTNKKIIEDNIDNYLQDLNTLYLQYMQLNNTKEVMEGHKDVLNMIQTNLDAKQDLIDRYHINNLNGGSKEETIATILETLWTREASKLDEVINMDTNLLQKNADRLYLKENENGTYKLNDASLNKVAILDYHFRSDHIYIHFKGEKVDIILISTIQKDKKNPNVFNLNFEAGFMNGYKLPEAILSQLVPFRFDLNAVNNGDDLTYSEQSNGFILFKSEKVVAE